METCTDSLYFNLPGKSPTQGTPVNESFTDNYQKRSLKSSSCHYFHFLSQVKGRTPVTPTVSSMNGQRGHTRGRPVLSTLVRYWDPRCGDSTRLDAVSRTRRFLGTRKSKDCGHRTHSASSRIEESLVVSREIYRGKWWTSLKIFESKSTFIYNCR